jgi:hypothetical protein
MVKFIAPNGVIVEAGADRADALLRSGFRRDDAAKKPAAKKAPAKKSTSKKK